MDGVVGLEPHPRSTSPVPRLGARAVRTVPQKIPVKITQKILRRHDLMGRVVSFGPKRPTRWRIAWKWCGLAVC